MFGSRSSARRLRGWIGLALIVAGAVVIAWSLAVLLWEDPVTGVYTAYRQRQLSSTFEEQLAAWEQRLPPAARQPARGPVSAATEEALSGDPPRNERAARSAIPPEVLRRLAARYRNETRAGAAIARLDIPRLGVSMITVNGTDSRQLRAGPGRHLATAMPGERRLVYIAGHRTTYGAPFSRIDELEAGDEVRLTLPYATVVYSVTGHTIVDDQDLSVLAPGTRERLALQACHPRFFASHRYIVWARATAMLAADSGD